MVKNMYSSSTKDQCVHNVPLKLRSGVTVVNVKPLFNYDSQNLIIACGADIRIFSIKSGECIHSLKYHTSPVIGLQESKRNMLQIFSCSSDGVVVRWDYTGKVLQVYDLKMPIVSFYVPSCTDEWFITKKFENQFRLYSLKPNAQSEEMPKIHLILKPVQAKQNSIDFDPKGKYVASIYENNLSIYNLESKRLVRQHKTGERNLTCVAFHPSDFIIATGDTHGRVIVWTNALDSSYPIRSVYHWHTLPVADVVFSPEGSHLHSGGGESALLKWNLFSEEKSLLPRMGAPIEYIIPSKDNSYVITTHSDNVLQVIDAQRNIVQVIQGLTKSQALYGKLLPVGLLYNSHLKALIMNGKPGHLQFYDIKQDKQMFNLDIASKNFMSQERDIAVHNIDVQKAAVDDSGLWLTTTEYWCNDDASPQIWLKFWEFNLEKQLFMLNTNVYLPHNQELNCILFRSPLKCLSVSPLALTTSCDKRFKIWSLSHTDDVSQSWGCEYMGYYRDIVPTCASFSEDGSVLAVAFGRAATLWRVEGLLLKAVLLCKRNERDIKQLLFGQNAGFKYLICHDGYSITAWDCVSFSIAWMVHYEIQLLVADVFSDNIAAFCKDQNLKIFKPDSPQPLDYIEKVSDSPIQAAVFVPSRSNNNIPGCFGEKSQLFFMDENQNLFTVSQSDDQEEVLTVEKRTVAQNIGETPFGMLQAVQVVSDVKKAKQQQFDISGEQKEANIITNPTWQDPELLLKSMLPKLLIRKNTKTKEKSELPEECNLVCAEDSVVTNEAFSVNFEEDWLTKALSNTKLKVLEFSFLTEMVKFRE